MNILLVGESGAFQSFEFQLSEYGVVVESCATEDEAVSLLDEGHYAAVAVDATLKSGTGLQLVERCVKKYPLVNFALVSTLSPEDFHEETEGLGIFMQLPALPGKEEAKDMLGILKKISGLMVS